MYIEDIFSINIEKINYILINSIFHYLIIPVICNSIVNNSDLDENFGFRASAINERPASFSFFGYYLNNLLLGMCFGLMFTIPFILIFFRSNTFNDRSCKKNDEIVFGYHPGLYLSFDSILALIVFSIFYRVDLHYCTKILLVLMTFIFQFISLFPDKINIYFPLDIQTKKGAIVFIGSLLMIFLLLINIFQINIVFNFDIYSILRWVFFVVLAVIVSKWYFNKKK